MRVFVTVVDLGSQSAAADHLDLSRPVVSRYLAELEDWVGARLMHRTTRKLSLTAAGSEILPRCRQIARAVSAICKPPSANPTRRPARHVAHQRQHLVRPGAIGARPSPHTSSATPGVTVDMQMLDRTVNLVDERIDLAIRTSNDLDPNLIARRLTVCRSVVCASPAYLREYPAPQEVEDLSPAQLPDPLLLRQKLVAFRRGRRTRVGAGPRQYQRQRGQHLVARDVGRGGGGDAAQLSGR